MAIVLIGTASWTDPTLIASGWYPDEAKSPEARLKHYARRFPLVEVDSTYYALPSLRNAELWVARTPARFIFDIKAFRLFTGHPTSSSALPADIGKAFGPVAKDKLYDTDVPSELRTELMRRFTDALAPLQAAGKLGTILLQFPPWMVYRPSNLEGVLRVAEALHPFPVEVNFGTAHGLMRSLVQRCSRPSRGISLPTWWSMSRRDLQRAFRRCGRQACQPWRSSVCTGAITIRGRRKVSAPAERFNYSYSHAEMEEFRTGVKGLAERAEHVQVLFNNYYGDKGVRDALEFRDLLSGAGVA